jgi:hypothetical protein
MWNLEVNDLKTELNFISRATTELVNHAHPKSRKIAGVWRNTAQAKIELLEHYCHSHHKEYIKVTYLFYLFIKRHFCIIKYKIRLLYFFAFTCNHK